MIEEECNVCSDAHSVKYVQFLASSFRNIDPIRAMNDWDMQRNIIT